MVEATLKQPSGSVVKLAKVTVEPRRQSKTGTIGGINRKILFPPRTLSLNWDNSKGPLAQLHSVMTKIHATVTSPPPLSSSSSLITRPHYRLNIRMCQVPRMCLDAHEYTLG